MIAEMRKSQQSLERSGVMIVALHFVVVVVHSAAHMSLHIDMNVWQSVYIFLVIVALPLLAGFLLWRRGPGGFLLLLCSMLGALVFGGYYHFIAAGIDNVASIGSRPWSATFQVTSVLLALTEAAGVLAGVVGVFTKRNLS
jgi:CHASE2 domain-containing sensor protein